jgi:hypothetical protein
MNRRQSPMRLRGALPALLALAAAVAYAAPAQARGFAIASVSFPPADPSAVTLTVRAPSAATARQMVVMLNGQNVTALLQAVPQTNTLAGTLTGLMPGENVLQLRPLAQAAAVAQVKVHVIGADDCNTARLGTAIDPALIGEPVGGVNLTATNWTVASASNQAYCRVNGAVTPVDPAAPNILFGVTLPQRYAYRYAQMGGGGMNGSIPGLAGAAYNNLGMATAGSDSGHQGNPAWAVNDESIVNFGYAQMKKTYDAAKVLQQRAYGGTAVFNYWFGNSQGGREGLTMAQRYPKDFDGVTVTVPVLSFSNLSLSRAAQRIQEIPLANWVTQAKRTAISTEFMRQCDGLDGLLDGVMNNYVACRKVFDVSQHPPGYNPWAAKRCPDVVDPNPADTSAAACLTDGQIETLKFTYTPYKFATPLVHGTTSFGMYLPGTDAGGNGIIVPTRYRGQEGASPTAPIYSWLGGPAVMGFLFQDLNANPLTYVEGGALNDRRILLSGWLDSVNPDLNAFKEGGGKLISVIGTNDTLASPGAQLDYYRALIETMGQPSLDEFARLWVLPMAGHGLSGSSFGVNGAGEPNTPFAIPNAHDRLGMIVGWVEQGIAPPMVPTVTAGARSLPMCPYPAYPHYLGGDLPVTQASSYTCATPTP